MKTEKYKEEPLELKNKFLEFLEPELEKIKSKHKNIEDVEKEISCAVDSLIAIQIFERELDDKELDIFLPTCHYVLFNAPVIIEVLSKLFSKI